MKYRDLRYLRVAVDNLDEAARFARDVFGLQASDRDDERAMFRSDDRNYSLCLSTAGDGEAIALTVAREEDLGALGARLEAAGYTARMLSTDGARVRQAKAVLATEAPNGVMVEIVWRPLTSGWRYHGPRDAGITDFGAVQLACTDVAANETFFVKGLGLTVSDWAGDAAYLALDEAHHRIALYPSAVSALVESLGAMTTRFQSNSSVFLLLSLGGVSAGAARLLISVAGGLFLLWWARRQADPIAYLLGGLSVVALLSPVLHPWYLLWLVPCFCVYRFPPMMALTGTVVLAYTIWPGQLESGRWAIPIWAHVLEYLPVVLFGLWEGVRFASRSSFLSATKPPLLAKS